jgi:hypothetical protein
MDLKLSMQILIWMASSVLKVGSCEHSNEASGSIKRWGISWMSETVSFSRILLQMLFWTLPCRLISSVSYWESFLGILYAIRGGSHICLCEALIGVSSSCKDSNWHSGFKQEAELYLSKFKWGKSFTALNHTMLDTYAACQQDSSVVAAQNKYLEEARLERESRYRGKHNRNEVFCQVWWLSIIIWILSWLISVNQFYSFREMAWDPFLLLSAVTE